MNIYRNMFTLKIIAFVALSSLFMISMKSTPAQAGDKVKWERIVGIIEPGGTVGGVVDGTPAPWTVTDGRAEVDLDNGRVKFKVRGLVIAADPSFANIGTTSVITMVKGTLVCNDTEPGDPELVDTDAVPLSAQGDADFNGSVDLPESCADEPEDTVVLIRIADVVDGFEFLIDLWNVFGAVRIP
ncbi:MAG: hypothetical protein ACREOW_09585 [Thermodesulfobacteriota bacterium]